MYILGKGEVVVLKKMGHGEHELIRMQAGEHFGEMALITNEHRTATIRAVTDIDCLRLEQKGFDNLLDSDPRFAQCILSVITRRLKETDEASTQDMLQAYHAMTFSLASRPEASIMR